ncbi:MAG: hypothetical protein E7271_05595 [Lachnospiraceae bacterium]|jgi:hypothetical protein|nr:hypothetical protein [Lachnospiraceae bacterium]
MKQNYTKKTCKMLFCTVMTVVFTFAMACVFSATTFAATDKGEGWSIDDAGVLTVTGGGSQGKLKKVDSADAKAWAAHKDEVTTIKVEGVVTTIGDDVFKGYSKVKTVEFADTVTEIGVSAFAECSELTTVKFPSGIIKIRQKAFQKCTSITEVTIPKTVVSIEGETTGPFAGCSKLTTVNFEDGLAVIPDRICMGCFAITKIKWPAGVTTIGKEAFENARDYTVGTLPATVTAVKGDAFLMCKDTTFTVPKNMTVFEHPFGGITEISFEAGTTKIPNSCCESVTSLKKVNWPEGVTEIGDFAFHITKLSEIIIPDTVTKVGKGAFSKNQDYVAKLYIPDSLKEYGENAFAELAINPLKYDKVVVIGSASSKAKEIVNKFKSGKYSYVYKEYVVPVKGKTYTVGDVKFKVTNAALDGTGTVAVVGFAKKSLKNITIPASVELGDGTFKITAINAKAFNGMSKAKKVTIKTTDIKTVGKKAFKGLSAKVKIKVPKAKLSVYKKLFKKGGLSKKTKVSK